MTAKVCLRCDWEGETKGAHCPDCGVPLYLAGAPRQATPRPKSRPTAADEPSSHAESSNDPPPDPTHRTNAPAASASITRSAGAFIVTALVLTVALDSWLSSDEEPGATAQSVDEVKASSLVAPTSQLDVPPVEGVGPIENLSSSEACASRCRHELTVGGVPFSFRVPTRGWEAFGDISVNKSIVGPQGAEAMIYWTTIPGDHANPCVDVLGMPVPWTVRELAAEVASAPGTELLAGPSNVTVGGRPGKHLELFVDQDLGCDPGFFFIWHDMEAGALWPATEVGHTISVWLVDVGQTPIFIAALTSEESTGRLYRETGLIVQSIRFEARPSS
jgi:hypothetical protein